MKPQQSEVGIARWITWKLSQPAIKLAIDSFTPGKRSISSSSLCVLFSSFSCCLIIHFVEGLISLFGLSLIFFKLSLLILYGFFPSLVDWRKFLYVPVVKVHRTTRHDTTPPNMATPSTRQWGVTPPISTILPTPDEVAANDELVSELKSQNNFESPAETERRYERRRRWLSRQAETRGMLTCLLLGTGHKCCSCFSASLSNSSRSSVARRACRRRQWMRLEGRSLRLEVIGWGFTDLVGDR